MVELVLSLMRSRCSIMTQFHMTPITVTTRVFFLFDGVFSVFLISMNILNHLNIMLYYLESFTSPSFRLIILKKIEMLRKLYKGFSFCI